jgi:hypothetical protein
VKERLPPPIPLRKLLEPTHGVVLLGKRHEVPGYRVRTWHEHGVQFRAGVGFNKRRRSDIDLVVWHWTGGEGSPLTMAKPLERRKLGIEFAIDRAGVLYQFCDPGFVDTADAGDVNHRSVGVEIVSYGMRSWDRAWVVPKLGRDRPVSEQRIHGKPVRVAAFYPAQVRAAQALAEVLSSVLDIPRAVPRSGNGEVDGEMLSPTRIKSFQGHCGHLHVSASKLDPGTALLGKLFSRAA